MVFSGDLLHTWHMAELTGKSPKSLEMISRNRGIYFDAN
jgi:hypothetical protein